MGMIRAVILESDPEAARQLTDVIQGRAGWSVENVPEADCDLLDQGSADVLAIDLSTEASRSLREQLTGDHPKLIAMADDAEAAMQAFEFNAVDFLPKPLKVDEIERALHRVELELKRDRDAHVGRILAASVKDVARFRTQYLERLIFKWKRRIIFLDLADVQWFEAEGNYITIHTAEGKYWIRKTMGKLEERLDPAQFLRVHRGLIVNLAHMSEIVLSTAEPHVVMGSGNVLPVGPLFHKRLGQLVVRGPRGSEGRFEDDLPTV
jgi:two-component system, LytTR family, response regulator